MNLPRAYRQILGIRFYAGDVYGALDRMRDGGLLVVPGAPALKDIEANVSYREALVNADVAITDSAFMVIIWNLLEHDSVRRLSGLEYLRALLELPDVRKPCETFWIMAGPANARKNLDWLRERGITVPQDYVYQAPMYGAQICDEALLEQLKKLHPRHIVVTIGGGTQERLGLYLKQNLGYLPAIHCVGAAIAFLSGDQVHIPVWADRFYLGWLFRCVSAPVRYVPRYWQARKLLPLIVRHRSELPDPARKIA
ncbi:MAG TPA: WecB/TagA/CpsF family glycosyltransferase [Silvibacterium sp.]|jgi:UDP-N-acetyl-D-mannosaminuronic acid transferase (WecB/TagA/CpsF family)|nr:WecB/TagA/CpsF family glycosyltransferase [Silvibacterium sp.]